MVPEAFAFFLLSLSRNNKEISTTLAPLLLASLCFQDIPGTLPFEKYSRDHVSDSFRYLIFERHLLIKEMTYFFLFYFREFHYLYLYGCGRSGNLLL